VNGARLGAFLLGITVLAVLTFYSGVGGVLGALEALSLPGLALVVLVHVPTVLLLGIAWWLIGAKATGASPRDFVIARIVRDATAEVLPFSQLGGFVFGIRTLMLHGIGAARAVSSMFVDLMVEFWAKIPYMVAGLLALLALRRDAPLLRTLLIALVFAIAAGSVPLALRGRPWAGMVRLAVRFTARWPGLPEMSRNIEDALGHILARRSRLVSGFALHLLLWFVGAAETWVILALMGARANMTTALIIDSIVSGLRTFTFLVPAAAGTQEASYVLSGALCGLSPSTSLALSLVRRARDMALGVPAFATWQILEARAGRHRDRGAPS
jgi:glycosyltransferase 2 family protein